ncbi:MAG TPA: AbrB/MazE/SpoVT family DNA-binding domain-containing protein [Armatimonadota bacterium]|nr:AbrB/MazE/SpoVT family DNA-binding domain-containing protein [Armatimonadota bacterium]
MKMIRMSTKGQVVIPAKLRKELGLEPGARLMARRLDDGVLIQPVPDDPVEAGYGAFAHLGPGTPGLLRDRREDLEREEAKIPWNSRKK